ncbi:MAG TPA: DinB family protein [Candidatus Angelobacter sp.]|nr:DinB family protein [Candidatus Angelobacter sp.]
MNALNNSVTAANADREFLLSLLRASREKFLGSFAGVAEADCRRCHAEGSWSVLETVEHLTMAETIQLKLITMQRVPRPADAPDREQFFLQVVADRSRKMESPESARPTGRFATLTDAAAQFKKTRDGVIQFAEQNTAEDMRATEVRHPHPAAGNVSLFEMLIIMARHAERHAAQIEEIRNALALNATAKGQS